MSPASTSSAIRAFWYSARRSSEVDGEGVRPGAPGASPLPPWREDVRCWRPMLAPSAVSASARASSAAMWLPTACTNLSCVDLESAFSWMQIRIGGRGLPWTGRHGIQAALVVQQLLVQVADGRVVANSGRGGQRPNASARVVSSLDLSRSEQRGERAAGRRRAARAASRSGEGPAAAARWRVASSPSVAAPEGSELGLGPGQRAVGLAQLLREKLPAALGALARPLDVQRLERMYGRIDDPLRRARVLRDVADVDDVGRLPPGDQEPGHQAVDDHLTGPDAEDGGPEVGT